MEGICILKNKKYDWATAKGLLYDLNKFINEDILQYDKDNIPEKTIKNF